MAHFLWLLGLRRKPHLSYLADKVHSETHFRRRFSTGKSRRCTVHFSFSLIYKDEGSWLEAHIKHILGARHIGQPCGDVIREITAACKSYHPSAACYSTGAILLESCASYTCRTIARGQILRVSPVVASRQSMVSWDRGSAASGRSMGPLNQYWKATLPESMLALEPTFATLCPHRCIVNYGSKLSHCRLY